MKHLLVKSKAVFIPLFILSIILVTFFYSGYSRAAAPAGVVIGQVIWVKGGTIKAVQPGTPAHRSLQRRSPIYEHDTLMTDKAATGQIALTDSSVVSLREDSQFKIDEYSYKKGGSPKDKLVMSVIKGGLRTITGAISKENPDAYKMNTPVATIGVRGTQYSVFMSPIKGLLVKMDKGSIEVTNGAGKMIFSKCKEPQVNKCIAFGEVSSSSSAPEGLSSMPSEFDSEPSISPIPVGFGEPGTGSDNSGGGSKTVSGFCIGFLDSIKTYFAAWA